jgi:hypothetical protein
MLFPPDGPALQPLCLGYSSTSENPEFSLHGGLFIQYNNNGLYIVLGPMDTHLYNSHKWPNDPTDRPCGRFASGISVSVTFRSFHHSVNYLFNTLIIGCRWCWARWIHIYTTVTNVPTARRTGPMSALLRDIDVPVKFWSFDTRSIIYSIK